MMRMGSVIIVNISPKYIEVSARQSGKTTRLISALLYYRIMTCMDSPVIVLSPNHHMSRNLIELYSAEYQSQLHRSTANLIDETRNPSLSHSILFTTVENRLIEEQFRMNRYNVVVFIDEAFDLCDAIRFSWIMDRTIYSSLTPTGGNDNVIRNLTSRNGGEYVSIR